MLKCNKHLCSFVQ